MQMNEGREMLQKYYQKANIKYFVSQTQAEEIQNGGWM